MTSDPGRLSIVVEHADGGVTRWGPDEVDGRDIPNDLSFGSSIPGGHQDMTCSLLRRIDQDYPDQDLYDTATVYGPGNRVAWQGRMQQFPRSHGASYTITPGAVGWSAHLRDNPYFREIYVDRDMARLESTSLARRAAVAASGTPTGKVQVNAAPGGIVMDVPNEAIPAFEIVELAYDAGVGLAVSRLDYTGFRTGASWAASWTAPTLVTATDEVFTLGVSTLALTFDGVARATAAFTANRYVLLQTQATAGHTPAAGHQQRVQMFNLIGSSGIPLYNDLAGVAGVRASDVITNVVSRAAPLLTYTTGAGGSIEQTDFVIPHVVFRDPVTPEDAISSINVFHLYDWGVYDNREFFFRQPDPERLTWEARLGAGAYMDADGLTGEQVINGVSVTYQDPTGVPKTVGPPGGSFDATDATLADTSSSNPVNSHGLPVKGTNLSLSFPTTQAGATQVGAAYLAERSLATRRGSMTLTGTVQHPTEGQVPVWRVRAGDWIRVADLNGNNADVPRKVISASYSHASRQVSLQLDNTVAKLDAILARVGIQTGIATGGGF